MIKLPAFNSRQNPLLLANKGKTITWLVIKQMKGPSHFQRKSPVFSKQMFEKCCALIEHAMEEMSMITKNLSSSDFPLEQDKRQLLCFGSYLYDYYLLAEDCLLAIARITDKWAPASLDWRYRLIELMQVPREGQRPPVISKESATLLKELLALFLNYHHHSANFSVSRIDKLVKAIGPLNFLLERELSKIIRILRLR